MTASLDARVAESVRYLADYISAEHELRGQDHSLLTTTHHATAELVLAGKHIRARLVHIAAGSALDAEQARAAMIFGAAVDLLHAGFLIHDDIIDRDDERRGSPTVHAAIGSSCGDPHVGVSLGLIAGDLAINGASHLVLDAQLPADLTLAALRILVHASRETMSGEALDIINGASTHAHPDDIRLANYRKTTEYSFGAPLKLGALAAGRSTAHLADIACALGNAYQTADDLAGAIGDPAHTGRAQGVDIEAGRATLMTSGLHEGATLADVARDVAGESRRWIALAHERIAGAGLPPDIAEPLHAVADGIERSVNNHV